MGKKLDAPKSITSFTPTNSNSITKKLLELLVRKKRALGVEREWRGSEGCGEGGRGSRGLEGVWGGYIREGGLSICYVNQA